MNKLILTQKVNFEDAINLLDNNGNGVLPVVDESNKLLGLITDGDIRKAILNKKLDLEHIINKNPFKLNIKSSKQQIISYLKKIHRRHIPLIDDENNFIEMFTLDVENFNLKQNWVVIMAGGLGTRLGELTINTPKPMLHIGNKPIVEHIIQLFVSHGFTKFMLSVNYKSEVIKEYFKDGNDFGIEVKYLEENKRLGTGGALSLIDIDLDEPFFVTNGDVMTSFNFENLLIFHKNENAQATMCVRKYSYQVPYGVVNIDEEGNVLHMSEKPVYEYYINTGIYILSPAVLKYIPKDSFFDLPDLFDLLKNENKIIKSFEISDFWIDIGTPKDYDFIKDRLKN